MKITQQRTQKLNFNDLDAGDLFRYNEKVYMKTLIKTCQNVSCVDLETGTVYDDLNFSMWDIERVNGELTIDGASPVQEKSKENDIIGGMHYPDSSFIEWYCWDEKEGLILHFESGREYQYKSVPFREFEDFHISASKGRYYNQEIKGQYTSIEGYKDRHEHF